MPDHSVISDWLVQWDELQEQGQAISLEHFIDRHCQGSSPELIEKFRSNVHAMRSMKKRIDEAKGRASSTGDSHSQDTAGGKTNHPALRPGAEPIAGYRLDHWLGKGGFGEVWQASAPGGLPVALKFVFLSLRRTRTELRALDIIKRVRHPHLLATFGAWERDDYLIVAMELADRSLLDRFTEADKQGLPGIPQQELLGYLAEAAKGLDYLNEPRHASEDQGLVSIQHRDVKPENLLLIGGEVKVADFGLARLLQGGQTGHSGCMTVAYAAPEFFDNRTTTQSDQYSLAVTYCFLRSGRLPFTGSNAQMMKGHLTEKPDLSLLPQQELAVVARALAKLPKDRWPSCGAFVNALRQAQEGKPMIMPCPVGETGMQPRPKEFKVDQSTMEHAKAEQNSAKPVAHWLSVFAVSLFVAGFIIWTCPKSMGVMAWFIGGAAGVATAKSMWKRK